MAFGQSAHQFTYPQLSHDVTANAQPYTRVSFFFKKRPEISYDQFFKYWQTVHADLTISVQAFGASNLQRYVQFHQNPDLKKETEAMGFGESLFDGSSDFYLSKWEDFLDFYKSPEFTDLLGPDSTKFISLPVSLMVGTEKLIYGKSVPGFGGKDGILELK